MIAKGTSHKHGAVLARYLVTSKDREHAQLWQLRGFALENVVDAFRCVHVMAEGTRCRAPFFHVYVRNRAGESLNREQWEHTANRIERALGLNNQPRAIAFHTAVDTGDTHMHVAWSRIDQDTLTAKPLPFFKQRLMKASRELEEVFDLPPVPNLRASVIRFTPTSAEEQQSRRLGLDIHATREAIKSCFENSGCGRSFQTALDAYGLFLAKGERRDFLVVDRAGGIHALGKRILGVSAAGIRERLADLRPDHLPNLKEARELIAAVKQVSRDNGVDDSYSQVSEASKLVGERKRTRTVTAETKTRAAGKGRLRDHGTKQLVTRCAHLPLDHLVTEPAMVESLLECQGDQLERLANEDREPPVEVAKNADSSYDFTGLQEQPREPLPPDAAAKVTPVIEAPLIVEQLFPQSKPRVYNARLRDQFRAVLKQLTKILEPRPARKRHREEIGGGFRKTALVLLRSIARVPPLHFLDPTWEPFTWLRLWEYNFPASTDFHQDCAVSPPPEDLSLRL